MKPSYEAVKAAWAKFETTVGHGAAMRAALSAAYAVDGVGAGVRLAMTDEEAAEDALDFWDARWGPRQTSEERMLQLVRRVRATVPADAPAFQTTSGPSMKVEGAFAMGAIKRNTDPADAPPQPDSRDAEIADLRRQIRLKAVYENTLFYDIAELRKAASETPAAVVDVQPFSVRDNKAVRQAAQEAAEAANTVAGIAHTVLAVDAWRKIAAAFHAIAGDDK